MAEAALDAAAARAAARAEGPEAAAAAAAVGAAAGAAAVECSLVAMSADHGAPVAERAGCWGVWLHRVVLGEEADSEFSSIICDVRASTNRRTSGQAVETS